MPQPCGSPTVTVSLEYTMENEFLILYIADFPFLRVSLSAISFILNCSFARIILIL
jgi:hypothetical protein